MIDISEIQCSLNRAVSSVFGISKTENELNSLKSLCSALDRLSLDSSDPKKDKLTVNYVKYYCNGNYYQFLENLRKLLLLFAHRFVNIKSVESELAHLYIKIFLNITNTFKRNNIAFQTELLCICVLKIWCNVLCINNSNKIDEETFEKNKEIFEEYVPLVINVYKCSKNEKEWSKLLYITLEILKNTHDEELLYQIFEGLECIHTGLKVNEVYPGVVSALINKLKELNRKQLIKSVNTLIVWFRAFLEGKKESNLSDLEYLKKILSEKEEKDELLNKTEESLGYLIRRFRNTHSEAVTKVCLSCVDYESLKSELRQQMCESILESVIKKDGSGEIERKIEGLSVSSKLIMRDMVSERMSEPGRKAVETFEAYLRIRGCFPWEMDEYMVIKFMIDNVEVDYEGMDDKVTVNRKYLVDAREGVSAIGDKGGRRWEAAESFCIKYFEGISKEKKVGIFTNLLIILKNSTTIPVYVRALHVLNDLVVSGNGKESFISEDMIIELRTLIISKDMFAMSRRVEETLAANVTKVKLMDLLSVVIRSDERGTLSHREVETMLFNVIPEVNSDYTRVSQSSTSLMRELKEYFNKHIGKEETEFRQLLEYYTNSLIKKVTSNIDNRGVSDVVYTLTSFNNRRVDMKVIFDLTVQFCKYFDEFAIDRDYEFDEKLNEVLYSFNYMLLYMKRYLIGAEMEQKRQECPEDVMDEDGKGDFVLSVSTLIMTRMRYYVADESSSVKYLALVALSRALEISSKNEYIYRIRVHEIWDCLTHSLENNINQYRIVSVLLKIYKSIVKNVYEFVEKRLIRILEVMEKVVFEDEQIVGVADERNGTIRYKCYLEISEFLEEVAKRVVNRRMFSKLMLISIKIHSPKTSGSIKEKLNEVFKNLSKKDPTLVRNVLIEVNKGEGMNKAFIKYALKRDGEWIKLNNCSVSKVVKEKLKELGIDGELVRNVESEEERKEVIKSIINFVNIVYKESGYFRSEAAGWNYLDSGELRVECVEKEIPECNFRVFVKDESASKSVEIRAEDVIKSSTVTIPTGRYTQQSNEYLRRKMFRGGKMSRLDARTFEAVRGSGVYKNLQYVAHKDGEEVYVDLFHDGQGVVHTVSPTISIRQGGPVLNLLYQNKNFGSRKALLNVASELNLFKLLNYNHKLTVNVYSDILDYVFWSADCSDCTLVNTFVSVTMNDMMALMRNINRLKVVDRVKASLKSKFSRRPKSNADGGISGIRDKELKEKTKLENLKEAALSKVKSTKSDGKAEELRNSQVCVRIMKKVGNLKYTLSPYLGSTELGLSNQVAYRLDTSKLDEPVEINASLNNSYKYRDEMETRERGREEESLWKYRAETRLMVTLRSRCRLLCRYVYGNKMSREDYRGLFESKAEKPFLAASHDLSVPVTFKFKIVPYVGVFVDLLFKSMNAEDLDVSLGVKFTVLNLTLSIPVLNKVKTSYVLNKFAKGTQNYHIGI
ncbi:conserved hypothetical protein [Theileria orientalis strain Shintoku]|uniref:Uncharacterized protein n=1 Tax=Theileria orientalis strain Shintoku TaxID=869250 RepID=J7M8J4_THEOR|nr:conserved hypothetical protein [Theileria orientalis strain Shintoku]BAM42348.1 conserved hypothetical protein [Theileria orientalis strain Shintoku]|eukprot:XP_009692649.1 conserved hypothetical protein [Theileria orientalis strain Shintoku]